MYLRHAIFRRFGGGRVPDARHVVVLETLPRPSSQCHLKVPTVSSSLRDDRRVGRPGRGTQCMDRVRTPSSTAAPARTPVGSQDRETGQSRAEQTRRGRALSHSASEGKRPGPDSLVSSQNLCEHFGKCGAHQSGAPNELSPPTDGCRPAMPSWIEPNTAPALLMAPPILQWLAHMVA